MNFTFTFLMDAIKVGRELAPAIDQHGQPPMYFEWNRGRGTGFKLCI